MPSIQLSSEELLALAQQLKNWHSELTSVNKNIKSTIEGMSSSWRDPQYQMFLNAIDTTHRQVQQYSLCLESLAQNLQMYAEQQQEMNSSFRSNMNSIN